MQVDKTSLNEQQSLAIDRLCEFFYDPSQRFITIQGFAGTGKTYLIQRFLRAVVQAYPKVSLGVSAPTNSAVAVLKEFGRKVGLTTPTQTIHSMLGLVLSNDGEQRSVKQKVKGNYNDFRIVIIDECSMLNRQIIQELLNRTHSRMKVIFMGDIYQLNPVNEAVSQSFSLGEQIRLSKVMRQEEGPLLSCIAEIRQQCIDGTKPGRIITSLNEQEDGVHLTNDYEFRDLLLAQFETQEFKDDPNFCRALAWTNREVLRLNKLVRTHLFGKSAPEFLAKEPITTLTPVYSDDEQLLFATNDQCLVREAEESIFTDYLDTKQRRYKIWRITLESMDGEIDHTVMAIHKDSLMLFNRRLGELAELCRAKKMSWSRFWQFKELFCDVRHIYANTVHRAQGQTITNVFVNVRDLHQNENVSELRRLFYVATSRASRNLIVNHHNMVA